MTLFTELGDLIKARLDWYRLDLHGLAVRGPAAPSLALIFAAEQGLNVWFWRGISLACGWLFYTGDSAHLLSSSAHSSRSLSQSCHLTFTSACRLNSRSSIYSSSVATMTSTVTLNTSIWCSRWRLGHNLSTCLAGGGVSHQTGWINSFSDSLRDRHKSALPEFLKKKDRTGAVPSRPHGNRLSYSLICGFLFSFPQPLRSLS